MENQEQQPTMFEKIYSQSEETLKAIQKPIVKNQVKRAISSAYDDAESKKYNAELTISDIRKDLGRYGDNLNDILKQQQIIDTCNNLQEKLAVEYKYLFGEEFPKTI